MKNAIKTLWNGIKAVFTAVIDWFATLFGMKEDTKYARVLRGIVSTAFAVILVVWAAAALYGLGRSLHWRINNLFDKGDDDYYYVEHLSENLSYYKGYYGNDGYLRNGKNRKVLKDIEWVSKPLEGDSLVCYSNGRRRGYFHLRDGRVVVKPKYQHAWIFSEGLAAVDEDGWVKFIDTKGDVVIDRRFAYNEDDCGYVFHSGRCAVRESSGDKMGIIDRSGKWVLPPVYDEVNLRDTFLVLTQGYRQAVLTFGMDTVIPMTAASFIIDDTTILATFADHSQKVYSLQGQLITNAEIGNVEQMMYETREVMYPVNKDGHECTDEYYCYTNPIERMDVATCLRYEGEMDWYGLMSPEGKILTPPLYVNITAVAKDLYLCETDYGRGIMLNSKGQPVEP